MIKINSVSVWDFDLLPIIPRPENQAFSTKITSRIIAKDGLWFAGIVTKK